tara:strand:- start:6793 stop:8541 length:1749 start_codon:yes stop_codon:yes gene_type:complete
MTMNNGVTGGNFATLADLQASKPRVNTVVTLNGTVYLVEAVNKGKGLVVNSLFANPINDAINVAQYGYDNAGVTAAIAAVKALAGALGDQYPSDGMLTLFFPAGRYNANGALITISLGSTGFNIKGEGITSQLDNIQISMDGAARCSVTNFMMRGALGYGVKSNSSGAFLSRQNAFSQLYIRDKTNGVVIDGSTWNTWTDVFVEKSSSDGWSVLQTNGEQVQGCYSVSNTGKGLYIEGGGEFKASGLSIHNNVGYGVHLYGNDAKTVVENYFEGLTSTIQQRTRTLAITAITSNSSGIQITTSAAHELANDMNDIQVTGTTNYNDTYNVVSVVDSTNLILDATYVSSESSGSINLPNWDLVIESDSVNNYRVNDQFFDGGNINYAKIKGYNCLFDNIRIKKQFFVESPSNLILRKGSARGRQQSTFNEVATSGTGLDGVFEAMIRDNNGSSAAGTASYKITGGDNELNVSSEGTKATALYSGNTGALSDDTVFSFTPPSSKGFIKVTNGLGQNARVIDLTYDTIAGTTALAGFKGAAIDRVNGILTGNTGADSFITVSAASDGKIYIENRNGTQKLFWTIFR